MHQTQPALQSWSANEQPSSPATTEWGIDSSCQLTAQSAPLLMHVAPHLLTASPSRFRIVKGESHNITNAAPDSSFQDAID